MQCCRFSHNLSQRSFQNKSEAPLGHATLRHSKPIENPKAMPQPVAALGSRPACATAIFQSQQQAPYVYTMRGIS